MSPGILELVQRVNVLPKFVEHFLDPWSVPVAGISSIILIGINSIHASAASAINGWEISGNGLRPREIRA